MNSSFDPISNHPIVTPSSGSLDNFPKGNGATFQPSTMLSGPGLHTWITQRSAQLFSTVGRSTPSMDFTSSSANPSNPVTPPSPSNPSNNGGNVSPNSIPTQGQVTQFMLYSFEYFLFGLFQGDQSFAEQQAQDRQDLQPET